MLRDSCLLGVVPAKVAGSPKELQAGSLACRRPLHMHAWASFRP